MFIKYRVNNNENLEDIASKYNTTVKKIQDLNNIYYLDSIKEGMDIIVPVDNNDYYNYYVVESGDSLYKIAKKYNINPELLAYLNGLTMDDYIYTNEEILLPKNNYSYYITKEGDTISIILDIMNTNLDNFLNNNKTIYLMPGQLLVNKKDN